MHISIPAKYCNYFAVSHFLPLSHKYKLHGNQILLVEQYKERGSLFKNGAKIYMPKK